MKSKIRIFKILSIFLLTLILQVTKSFAQNPPHLDSLIFLPFNEPIMKIDEDGLKTIDDSPGNGNFTDYGFESNPALPEYKSKEDIWRNAPVVVEGRTMPGTFLRFEQDVYPALFVSQKEVYEVYSYALTYVYRGDLKGDTIFILLPRYNYNKLIRPYSGHSCKAYVYARNIYSMAFLKPIIVNGYTYYTPCNTDYEGFEWENSVAKFSDNSCDGIFNTKQDLIRIFSEKGFPLQVKRSITDERKEIEVKKENKKPAKKSDAIPVTGQKIEDYLRDKGWL